MRGDMIKQYFVGQLVSYKLKKQPDCTTATGIVCKLHMSCKRGSAEIRPSNGTRKVTRRLIHVNSME
jgi:hypothetical protein